MSEKNQKKSDLKKYLLYFGIILIATGISLTVSLWGQFDEVLGTLKQVNIPNLLIMIGVVVLSYFIEGFIYKLFVRLYKRKYHLLKGVSVALTGQFYSDITPGASGGQVMQAYTLKNQGVPISAGASIFVMCFILYQCALIVFDIIALFAVRDTLGNITTVRISSSFEIPMAPLIIAGFGLNVVVTLSIFLMSFSKLFLKLITGPVIGLLAKLKIVKDRQKMIDETKATVENYKLELKRLFTNLPLAIFIFCMYLLMLFIRCSMPYFSGLALEAYSDNTFSLSRMFEAAFLGCFHQMVTGMIPIPGSAGISEYFFEILFFNFYGPTVDGAGNIIREASVNVVSAQILWRVVTFHLMFIVSGLFVALYREKPKESFSSINRKTLVTLQMATLEERRNSVEELRQTRRMNRLETVSAKEKKLLAKQAKRIDKENKKILKMNQHHSKKGDNKSGQVDKHPDWDTMNLDL